MNEKGKEMPGVIPQGTPNEVPQGKPQDVPEMPGQETSNAEKMYGGKPSNIQDPDISDSVC